MRRDRDRERHRRRLTIREDDNGDRRRDQNEELRAPEYLPGGTELLDEGIEQGLIAARCLGQECVREETAGPAHEEVQAREQSDDKTADQRREIGEAHATRPVAIERVERNTGNTAMKNSRTSTESPTKTPAANQCAVLGISPQSTAATST